MNHGLQIEEKRPEKSKGQKTAIIITGATATGKTEIAVNLAEKLNCAIISADSRQCFHELKIGVARPSPEELKRVKHYFVDEFPLTQLIDAAFFERYAIDTASKLFLNSDYVIVTGGTGLYIKAFTHGLDDMPAIDPEIRAFYRSEFEQKGIQWLQEEVKKRDPLFFEKGEMQNPVRLLRALETIVQSGQSILAFRHFKKKNRPFHILSYAITMPRPLIYNRINERVDLMMRNGLLKEVESLKEFRGLTALKTVGYQELFPVLDGIQQLDIAVDEIKRNTRHYAKRQLTWIHKNEPYHYIKPGQDGLQQILLDLAQ